MSTDVEWERWGARDPYFGVLTDPKFRSADLTVEARREFFESGEWHAGYVIDLCRRHVDADFAPQRILDFGCGVGRVAIPFARRAAEVVGLDVAPSMLAEAKRNCDAQGVRNLALLPSDDNLSTVEGTFDLVHSCIVLQHLEISRGRALFERLVKRVRPGGIAALQVTYAWDIHADRYGQPPPPVKPTSPGRLDRLKGWLRQRLRPGRTSAPLPPSQAADPEMQMNFYNLSELLFIVQRAGGQRLHVELTDHGGAFGVFMFFKKPA